MSFDQARLLETCTVGPHSTGVHHCNLGLLNSSTIHILDQIVLCCGVLPCACRVCTIPGLLDASSIAPSPSCDNQKCLQMLSRIPSRAKLSPVEKPFKLNWTLGYWNQLTLKDPLKTNKQPYEGMVLRIIYCITHYFPLWGSIGEIYLRHQYKPNVTFFWTMWILT